MFKRLLTFATSLVLFISSTTSTEAANTPPSCPSGDGAKYECTYIVYSPNTPSNGQVQVTQRNYSGGTGMTNPPIVYGSNWYLRWAKDWTWNGGGYSFQYKTPSSSTFSNPSSSSYYSSPTNVVKTYTTSDLQVQFQFQHYEPNRSPSPYWCGWLHHHFTASNSVSIYEYSICSN